MNTRNHALRSAYADGGREASARHQGLYRPHEDQRIDRALEQISLEDRGEAAEDYLRDRRSRGVSPIEAVEGGQNRRRRIEHR